MSEIEKAREAIDEYKARVDEAEIERDRARVKADAFERDWLQAKHEFFSVLNKTREELHRVTRRANRLEKVALLVVEKKLGYHDPPCDDGRCLGCLARQALAEDKG